MANNRFVRLVKIVTGVKAGADEEFFQLEGRLERFTHFWTLVARHFVRNRCLIRASALAYTTLLALIPLLAVVISISSSLLKNQDEDKFYQAIASIAPPAAIHRKIAAHHFHSHSSATVRSNFPAGEISTNTLLVSTNPMAGSAGSTNEIVNAQKEVARELHHFVQNTQGGAMGVTGTVIFIFIAIAMLSRIEETFNDIWGVAQGRNWLRRIVLYWTTITLGPLLLLTAGGLAGTGHFQTVKNYFQHMPLIGNLIFELLPLFVLWLAFALIYLLVPNTKVNFSAAFIGGAIAGTLWHLNSAFGFLYVSRVVTNTQIYGKLGLVPVFMIGLYFSWAILLFGAQVAYAFQNRAVYLQDKLADHINQRGRELIALRLMTRLAQQFQSGLPPATVGEISTKLAVPSRLTQQIFRVLAAARLVTEVGGAETAYVPARPLETISAHDVLTALRCGSGRELPADKTAVAEIYGEFARIEEAERTAAEKISLLTLIQRAPAQLAAPESNQDRKK